MIPRPTRTRRRLRLRLRHPVPYWLVALGLTALTATTIARVTDAAAAERARWGERVPVAVATADLEPGDELRAEVRLVPASLVPDGALAEPPDGQVVATWIGAGEIVLTRRLAPAGLSPIAAMLPPGTGAVAVPPGIAPLPLEVGDVVDVLGTRILARGALVVATSESAVTIAVAASDVADVAYEATNGSVTLVLTGVGSAGEQPE